VFTFYADVTADKLQTLRITTTIIIIIIIIIIVIIIILFANVKHRQTASAELQ